MFTTTEFEQYRESWSKPPIYPWLPEFEEWVAEKYDVTVFPTISEERTCAGDDCILFNFDVIVYSDKDLYRIFDGDYQSKSVLTALTDKVKSLIAKYDRPKVKPNDVIRVLRVCSYTYIYLIFRLLGTIFHKEEEKIKRVFSNLKLFELYLTPTCEYQMSCIFNTKAEAKQFLLSDEFDELRLKVYDILKPYDEHNILKPEHIRLVPDYEENFLNSKISSMYGRWLSDMDEKEYNWFIGTLLEGE